MLDHVSGTAIFCTVLFRNDSRVRKAKNAEKSQK